MLGEFYVITTRKLARTLTPAQALEAVRLLCDLEVQPLTAATVQSAIVRVEDSMLSYWDALIVESAIAAGTVRLLTEDLNHTQRFDTVEVTDPFATLPSS